MTSIRATVIKNQLQWSGNLVEMDDPSLPKQIFYSQLKEEKSEKRRSEEEFQGHSNTKHDEHQHQLLETESNL